MSWGGFVKSRIYLHIYWWWTANSPSIKRILSLSASNVENWIFNLSSIKQHMTRCEYIVYLELSVVYHQNKIYLVRFNLLAIGENYIRLSFSKSGLACRPNYITSLPTIRQICRMLQNWCCTVTVQCFLISHNNNQFSVWFSEQHVWHI